MKRNATKSKKRGRLRIFLSHSSEDKPFVRKIEKILQSQGYKPWIDEKNIPLGESITKEIEKALRESDVILVFLSKESVKSAWVNEEWRSKFFDQVKNGQVLVLPLLIEECDIPQLLKDRKYADFTKSYSYESNISLLLRRLKEIELDKFGETLNYSEDCSIFEYTKEFLYDLKNEEIVLPIIGRIPIIDNLKKIRRSGKLVRLENFINKPKIKIRSIYDHTLSIAHLADCLLPVIENTGITVEKHTELARIIAFHEFNEIILGDIPSYTNLMENKRILTLNPAEQTLRLVDPTLREDIANKFIWMFLNEKQKKSFEAVLSHLSETQSNLTAFFRILDKIDPIISVWKYLRYYRRRIKNIDEFLRRLKDFFEYPEVKKNIEKSQFNTQLYDFIAVLQNINYAKKYYENSDFLSSQSFGIPLEVVKNIIEKGHLFSDGDL
jgi:5'-deoxynucleotidase YfbR-like HD superfamily hydrolase